MSDGTDTILPLTLEKVSYAVGGTTIIDDVTAEFGAGTRTVIVGANGAGKSTLLRLCHGLLAPTSGRIRWRGPLNGQARRRQAMVFQRPVMLRRSALGNVIYALALARVPRAARARQADQALARFDLAGLAHRPARVLSGGEQQRLALARAWALRPEVLFLDEPTANLDPGASRAIETMIETIHGDGTKIIMTTHNLGQARRIAEDIVFLDRGRIHERAPADRFFAGPATAEARDFMRGELP